MVVVLLLLVLLLLEEEEVGVGLPMTPFHLCMELESAGGILSLTLSLNTSLYLCVMNLSAAAVTLLKCLCVMTAHLHQTPSGNMP